MFEKAKARVAKLEEDHENLRKLHQHVEKNKVVYATIGASVVTAVVMKTTAKPQITNVINTFAPVNNNLPTFNNTVNNGGHMRKIVRCVETGEMWLSVTEAARAQKVNLSRMSQHLNGHKDHINSQHFVIEALATG